MFTVMVDGTDHPFGSSKFQVKSKDDIVVTDNGVLVVNTYASLNEAEIERGSKRDPSRPIVVGHAPGQWTRFRFVEHKEK